MWIAQMLEGIKQNKNRMLIAMEIGVPVHNISKEALRMIYSHEYRKAGITDRQFAMWFDASLIGLQTVDGEPATERTEPDEKHVESLLQRIQRGYEPEFDGEKIKQSANPQNKDCFWCRYHGSFGCCPSAAYADNRALTCRNYRRV